MLHLANPIFLDWDKPGVVFFLLYMYDYDDDSCNDFYMMFYDDTYYVIFMYLAYVYS
jgi:hypothetical protein